MSRSLLLGLTFGLLLACGEEAANTHSAGSSQGATASGAAGGGTKLGSGGLGTTTTASGASLNTGGAKLNSGGATTASGGVAHDAGGTQSTGVVANTGGATAASGGTTLPAGGTASAPQSCNPSGVTCKIAVPVCAAMQVPKLNASGSCYTGECLPIGDCSCNVPADCPDNDQYTCRNDIKRCTPYLY